MKPTWGSRKRIIGFGAIVLLAFLMMNMNSRLSEYFRLSSERDKIKADVVQLRATKAAMEAQATYASSDQAVVEWARREAHMALPGDKVVIPMSSLQITPTPIYQPTTTVVSVENWETWWALFFSERD